MYRRGVESIKHPQTRLLWLQDELREKRLSVTAVAMVNNHADLMTKATQGPRHRLLSEALGLRPASDVEEKDAGEV